MAIVYLALVVAALILAIVALVAPNRATQATAGAVICLAIALLLSRAGG